MVIRMSATHKRLHLMESHMSSYFTKKSKADEETKTCTSPRQTQTNKHTNSTAYWRESTNTLSHENSILTDRLAIIEAEHKNLKETVSRLTSIKKEMELNLSEANKEIMHLAFIARNQCTPMHLPTRSKVSKIPINTLGKDAMYWYQTCRTMEAQHLVQTNEMETKINELMNVISAKRKRQHINQTELCRDNSSS
jgi:hypothetical protein